MASRVAPPASTTARALTPANALGGGAPEALGAQADPDRATIRTLRQAASLYETFIAKAGDDPSYADAVRRSRERLEDIEQTIEFLEKGIAARKDE